MATATVIQTQRGGATAHETSPETMEAVITSGEMRGRIVHLTKTPEGALNMSDPELTPDESEVLKAVAEASKKAEVTAIRAGKTAERVIERMQRLRKEMREDNDG